MTEPVSSYGQIYVYRVVTPFQTQFDQAPRASYQSNDLWFAGWFFPIAGFAASAVGCFLVAQPAVAVPIKAMTMAMNACTGFYGSKLGCEFRENWQYTGVISKDLVIRPATEQDDEARVQYLVSHHSTMPDQVHTHHLGAYFPKHVHAQAFIREEVNDRVGFQYEKLLNDLIKESEAKVPASGVSLKME